jgi:hypothetical protein
LGKDCLPKRLILVDKRHPIHLVELATTESASQYRYATLTHRWSKDPCLELKHENKRQIQQKIALHTLPMAFEDAMRVCQFLDIPYLWIDQLCVLLDDDDELADEISNMGYIYENAHVNIGAMVAAETVHEDRRNGLFVDRQNFAFSNNPVCARIRRRGYEKECSILDDDPRMDLNFKDIMRCGGIMQERILSPRSIFF